MNEMYVSEKKMGNIPKIFLNGKIVDFSGAKFCEFINNKSEYLILDLETLEMQYEDRLHRFKSNGQTFHFLKKLVFAWPEKVNAETVSSKEICFEKKSNCIGMNIVRYLHKLLTDLTLGRVSVCMRRCRQSCELQIRFDCDWVVIL